MASPAYRIHTVSSGSVTSSELADVLAETIAATGREVERQVDRVARPEPGTLELILSPGEYFSGIDAPLRDRVRAAATSIGVGTALPGDGAFEVEARYAAFAPAALTFHRVGARELRRRQIEASHLPFGYHPGWDLWGGGRRPAPLDATILGSLTEHRARWIARAASTLTEWTCDLRLFDGTEPVRAATDHFVTGNDRRRLLASSRTLLDIPRSPGGPINWVLVVEAMTNGCAVLSAGVDEVAPFSPGVHLVLAPPDQLAAQALSLLIDEDRRAEMAERAYRQFRRRSVFAETVDRTLAKLEARPLRLLRSAATPRRLVTHRPTGTRSDDQGSGPPASPGGHANRPAPAPGASTEAAGRVRKLIKGLALSEIEEVRQIEALESVLRTGSADHVEIYDTSTWARAVPEVSVLISLFNYREHIREAIHSVVVSEDVAVELVVVDDHSTDDSVAVVRATMDELDDYPVRLVASAANRGVSAARNVAFAHARADLIFVMDADNVLYPRGLKVLVERLEADGDAAFAYGILERFGLDEGLISCLPWDVERLCRANYIDVMALLRRSAWLDAGGFDPAMDRAGGFEDWDLWLHLAAQGRRADLVTEIVGRYRVQAGSHISLINLDTDGIVQLLHARYPELPWPTPS